MKKKRYWVVVYKTLEEMLADGYTECTMGEMIAWYVKEGKPTLSPIYNGYGYLETV